MKSRLINEYILLHKNKQERNLAYLCGIPMTGHEPARSPTLEPKSSASANSATPACEL